MMRDDMVTISRVIVPIKWLVALSLHLHPTSRTVPSLLSSRVLALQASNDSRFRVNPSTIHLCPALEVCGL
jgi:hypothetical protein